jgi:membrane protein DedA with SNARE-associated domain
LVERSGGRALAAGRAAPGFRTLAVIVAATSAIRPRRALTALFVGGSVFVQLHVCLGYLFGPPALHLVRSAFPVALAVGMVLLVGAFIVVLRRRGRQGSEAVWAEAACPACLALGHFADRQLAQVVVR